MISKIQNRFSSIDGLRGVLILFVMAHHFAIFFRQSLESQIVFNIYASIGYLSVRTFFIVSGFLIFHQMVHRDNFEKFPKLGFYIRRFFRIFPLWVAVLIFYFEIYDFPNSVLLMNLSFLFGFNMYKPGAMVLAHSWSLFVEEIFYLIFPWIFIFLKQIRLSIIFLIAAFGISYFWQAQAAHYGVPTSNYFIEFFPLSHFHFFLIGILCHNIMFSDFGNRLSQLWRKYVPQKLFVSLLLTVSYLVFLPQYANDWPILFASLPFIAALSESQVMGKIFKNKILSFIGLLCYPLYLIHMFVLQKFLQLTQGSLGTWPMLYFLAFILVCLIISFAAQELIEKPFLRLGKRLLTFIG